MLCVSQAVLSVVLGAWSVRFVGWADWVDCRCFLSFVFLGVARRLELSPCNTRMSQQGVWTRRADSPVGGFKTPPLVRDTEQRSNATAADSTQTHTSERPLAIVSGVMRIGNLPSCPVSLHNRIWTADAAMALYPPPNCHSLTRTFAMSSKLH